MVLPPFTRAIRVDAMKSDSQKTSSFANAKTVLKSQIAEVTEDLRDAKNAIRRLEIKIEPIDVLSWLGAQKAKNKVYWSSRDGSFETGGIGLAYALHGTNVVDCDAILTELERYFCAENKHLKFFGGISFGKNSAGKEWEAFGSYRFVLPQFEISRRGIETFFACNLYSDTAKRDGFTALLKELDTLDIKIRSDEPFPPSVQSRADEPNVKDWQSSVKKALLEIEKGTLEKVVLARRSIFSFNQPLDALLALKRLKEISPECFHFCFAPDEGLAFIGASPERLYKREGRMVSTEALAGTRPRGTTSAQDEDLKNDLLTSNKEREEHFFVINFLKSALGDLCSSLSVDPNVGVLSLSGGHHLLTFIEGSLNKGVDDALLLKSLHPTPAVCGAPGEKAIKIISANEPFKRGWYAGAIGFIGQEETEFAVSIRCGLINQNKLFLFAGAGIVAGSNPEEEWEEIETKLASFTKIFENRTIVNKQLLNADSRGLHADGRG